MLLLHYAPTHISHHFTDSGVKCEVFSFANLLLQQDHHHLHFRGGKSKEMEFCMGDHREHLWKAITTWLQSSAILQLFSFFPATSNSPVTVLGSLMKPCGKALGRRVSSVMQIKTRQQASCKPQQSDPNLCLAARSAPGPSGHRLSPLLAALLHGEVWNCHGNYRSVTPEGNITWHAPAHHPTGEKQRWQDNTEMKSQWGKRNWGPC